MTNQKQRICDYIDQISPELLKLSADIHANPETLFNEYKSSGFIVELLKKHGYTVTEKYCGIDTSFRASKKGNGTGPKIAFFAEYDALPEIGHACGHNVIATCATGAFLAVAQMMEEYAGEISIIGTPAEEGGGGKILILDAGGFEDIEYGIMMHPSSGRSIIGRGGRAATGMTIDFKGKAAHSSDPSGGINALNAVISTFNHIDMIRPTLNIQSNINGIITKGGSAANAIPDYAQCKFSLRASTLIELEKLVESVKRCVASAELLTGAKAEIKVSLMSAERYPNLPMGEALKANMLTLGEEMGYPDPNALVGSSDIGNVSIVLPCIHDYLYIAPDGVNSHNADFTVASISPRANEICIKGAKGLAMTALDILEKPELQDEINAYYEKQIPAVYKERK